MFLSEDNVSDEVPSETVELGTLGEGQDALTKAVKEPHSTALEMTNTGIE